MKAKFDFSAFAFYPEGTILQIGRRVCHLTTIIRYYAKFRAYIRKRITQITYVKSPLLERIAY